jgi:hypothetical protein
MHRPIQDSPEDQSDVPVLLTLDGRLADLLAAIAEEAVPDRLLRLARELQAELVRRKRPNRN